MFLSTDTISLTATDRDRAAEFAQRSPTEAQQWQRYVEAMARLGIEQWLHQRAPELEIHPAWRSGSLVSSEPIGQLQVGKFRLCLIATDDLNAVEIPISQTVLESAFNPQVYVFVEVLEEIGQVQIRSAIQQSTLISHLRSQPPEAGTYWLNPEWFEANPNRLLLWLRCLDAAAIPTVAYPAQPQPKLQPSAMNIGLWLNDRLDQMAQDLAWVLLPPPTPEFAFRPLRSPVEEFNHVLTELTQQGRISAPPQARGGYRDFQWEGTSLRLYAFTWKVSDTDWSLLLVLGTQPGTVLPIGTRLQVQDEHQILAEPVLCDRTQDYLFTQVIGTGEERFWVSIHLNSGTALTLPPFTFITTPNHSVH
jgi:hypothetical protein